MSAGQSLVVNLALTGMVPTKADNPHVPLAPDEIADEAARCVAAGLHRPPARPRRERHPDLPARRVRRDRREGANFQTQASVNDPEMIRRLETQAADNLTLVERAAGLAHAAGRAIATPARARELLGLRPRPPVAGNA